MPYYGMLFGGFCAPTEPPKVGRPHRDRSKVKAARKASRKSR